MGYCVTPEKGSKLAPCEPSCAHLDCADNRKLAANPCPVCKKPLGYGEKFYFDGEDSIKTQTGTHAICFWEKVERERAAKEVSR